MSGTPIAELNEAVRLYFEGISQDALLKVKVQLSVVSFSDNAKLERDFATANGNVPKLHPDSGTDMKAGFEMASRQVAKFQQDANTLKPVVIMITDGMPNNKADAVNAAQALLQHAHVYALGVTGADKQTLQDMVGQSNASMLSGANLASFFSDLSASLSAYIANNMKNSMGVGSGFAMQNNKGWRK